jgi:retinol-binding protein 3
MNHRARSVCLGLLAGSLAACGTPSRAPAPASPSVAEAGAPTGVEAPEDLAACPAAPLPDTPIGQRTTALIEVVNRGDVGQIETLVTEQLAPEFQQVVPLAKHVEIMRGFHDQTGGVTVCRVEYSSATEALVLLGAKRGDAFHSMTITVEDAAPHRVSGISVGPASRAALDDPPSPLDDAARHAVIEGVASALDDYIFADVAAKMQARIRAERDAGHYAELTHRLPLARRLTADLRAVSKDKHLSIHYSAASLPPETAADEQDPTPEQQALQRAAAASEGFGIARVEVLDGNIGYVDIRGFHPVEVVREGLAEAMTKIADTKALIVDLRHNHGGDPATVAFVTSYLFGEKKVHLNDLYYRRNDETTEFWTDPSVPGKRFGKTKPIFVLTSGETFSAGEEFAYNLRARKRATLIGEATGGGAHPVDGARVDEHIMAIVPVGRAINPITKSNWEGTGVQPHIAVPANEAMDTAKALIAAGK